MSSTYSYRKDEEIYGQGNAATYCYQVANGAIRISCKLTNGRRQIGAFYLHGDIFGFPIYDRASFECVFPSMPSALEDVEIEERTTKRVPTDVKRKPSKRSRRD